jgi:hypothetical protein
MNRDKPHFSIRINVVLALKRLSQDFFFEPFDEIRNGIWVSSGGGAVMAGPEAV